MLTKLRLHNYRTFLNTELLFSGRDLLIGRNNSGKSNLCSAIRFLGATASMDLRTATGFVPGGVTEICNWMLQSNQVDISCTCNLMFENEQCEFVYDLSLKVTAQSQGVQTGQLGLKVAKERLSLNSPSFSNAILLDNDGHESTMRHEEQHVKGRADPHTPKTLSPPDATMLSKLYDLESNRRARHFRMYLSRWNYYALSPDMIRTGAQKPAPILTWLDPRGECTANAVFHIKSLDEARYRRIIDHVRRIEPGLDAINFFPVPDQGAVPLVAMKGRPRASWNGLSDGTLRALAIAYIVEMSEPESMGFPGPPTLSVIEEPENGICPPALRSLFALFEERASQAQFIFTSHSPYFIDFFDWKRSGVHVLRRNNDRTEVESPAQAGDGPDRLTLSEEFAAELIG